MTASIADAAAPQAYRPDIDGLRAVSVLAVLAYHAHLPYAGAGFLGVDVFFVISGFLITGLLLRERATTGRIDLAAFWARRVRRLAPAFLAMMLCLLLAAPFLTQRVSGETGELVRSALAALFINANHYFLIAAGDYFGAAAEHNPLLHTWSLSVEEQFYLVWPILIALAMFRRRWLLPALTGGVLLASLLLAASWQGDGVNKAFYLMPARAWQLMAGAALAVFLHRRAVALPGLVAGSLGLAGLALVALPMVLGPSSVLGPLWLSALPVAGAVMLILTGSPTSPLPMARLLAWPPMVYIGKISYPLYLWHWPVLVLMRGQRLHEPSLALDLSALALSLVLATITHEFIEKGVWRRVRGFGHHRVLLGGFAATATVAAVVLLLGAWVRFGIGYTATERQLDASRRDKASTGCMFEGGQFAQSDLERCFAKGASESVLLWGDSHAEHWAPGLKDAVHAAGGRFGVMTANGCRPLPPPMRSGGCDEFNSEVLARLAGWTKSHNLRGIVVSGRWADGMGVASPQLNPPFGPGEFYDRQSTSGAEARKRLRDSLSQLISLAATGGLRVLIVLPSPTHRYTVQQCLAVLEEGQCFSDRADIDKFVAEVTQDLRGAAAGQAHVRLFDPTDVLCQGGRCPMVIGGRIAYSDDDHISRSFSKSAGTAFAADIPWLLGIDKGISP